MPTPRFSAALLGEVLAHVAFRSPEPLAEVLEALGHGSGAAAEVGLARDRLHRALDADLTSGGIDELRAFVTAFDAATLQLRAQRPQLSRAHRESRATPGPAPTAVVRSDLGGTWCADRDQVRSGREAPLAPLPGPILAPPFVPRLVTAPRAQDSGTMFMPDDEKPRSSLPFAASAAEDLDGYVALTIALASGEDRDVVLARFGLSEEDRQRLSRLWAGRIARDPALADRFRSLLREKRGG